MTELVTVGMQGNAAHSHLLFAQGRAAGTFRKFLPARNVLMLGVLLALLQAADGILTSVGINRFGITIEGNPFLRSLMEEFGHIPTLALVKLLAIIVVVSLTIIANRLPWVKSAMGAVTCIYLFAAILPWTYILFFRPL